MTAYPNVDKHLGLHQRLVTIYVVDGFEVSLSNEEGYRCTSSAGTARRSRTPFATLKQSSLDCRCGSP